MTETNPEAVQGKTQPEKSAKLSAARQAATTSLINAHRDEFNSLMEAKAKELGVEWKRKLTSEERAEAELEKLLAANPQLKERFAAEAEAKQFVTNPPQRTFNS